MTIFRHEKEYVQLKGMLAEMATMASSMVSESIRSLVDRDSDLARKVVEKDEHLDQLDVDIDEHCIKMLALFEPKAVDLRYIITASRIIIDLERVGDHCVSISREALQINDTPQLKPYIDLPKMAENAVKMINDSLQAFFDADTKLAFDVIKRDSTIDQLNDQVIRELLTYSMEDIKTLHTVLSLMNVSRRLERVADHATNIAEMVYYMVEGKIIRHTYIEETEEEN
ncbi:phosphate uptake regulator, PhoU [Denitrovibrio acetiphilus DSM 12809]|uniref:Phosphate-specific transport system accessory protein PhoU n=1 Tax=Denitrovibrio acetiphilus (strain DSM 12809 / NBRC 114555 / N2460) TaxID=522772 RepID=D4H7K3_DENA2|nr:phosphate signaling complex protein PhoU [Denitrovibrio acetiphilus]ADD68002.1 phosphate uptake regulator, PhoU [Denitrovibrio acetiphilus DSM 12809]